MEKITSNKLKNYGAMSSALLATIAASGQILTTDIDDVTIDESGGTVEIDLNQDSVVDFVINMGLADGGISFTTRAGDGTAAPTDPPTTNVNGAFIGITASGFNYPALLQADDLIDPSVSATAPGARGDLNFYGCAYTNSAFCGDVTDGYIGLVFDFNGNNHYGWVQLDSSIENKSTEPDAPGTTEGTATIKAYALNLTPEEAINAGQTLSLEDNSIDGFSSFVRDNILSVNAKNPIENITIHNLSGQEVITQKTSSLFQTVDLNSLSTGIYIATVAVEGQMQAIKIVKK